jgi:LysM repeat protein
MVPISTAILAALADAMPTCVNDELSGWQCVEVAAGDTLFSIAAASHVNPEKLCDYNSNSLPRHNCSILEVGTTLRVPTDACVPKDGAWKCHHVQSDNESLADLSTERTGENKVNTEYLGAYNERVLWGNSNLWPNMDIKIPFYHCHPAEEYDCHTVQAGEDLYSVAKHYLVNAGNLASWNSDTVLPGANYMYPGVELKIPRTTVYGYQNSAPAAAPGGGACRFQPGISFCYKIKHNDTLDDLARHFNVPMKQLCMQAEAQYNAQYTEIGAPNCSRILDVAWLNIPTKRQPGLVPLGGKCRDSYGYVSPFDDYAKDRCVPGGVCDTGSDTCKSCGCQGLTPCRVKYSGTCKGLELTTKGLRVWQCPAGTELCGDFPTVYPVKKPN